MAEHETEDSFTGTHEENAALAEVLARAPAGAPLGEWVGLLGKVVTAFLDRRLVWFWDLDRAAWVPGVIGDGGTQDGRAVFDVDLCHGGPLRWGYEWQFMPLVSMTEPAAPDLATGAP